MSPDTRQQLLHHHHSIQKISGQVVSTTSEINHNVVHAGLSLLPKHFQIDSVLLQEIRLMLSSPQKTWLTVTPAITDAKEVISTRLGNTLKVMEFQLISVNHTHQVVVLLVNARTSARMDLPHKYTNVNQALLN